MKKIHLLMVSFAGVILLTNAEIGHAEDHVGMFNITPSVGYEHFATKRNLTWSTVPALSAGYLFTPEWGVEGTYGILNATDKVSQQQVRGSLYLLDGLYHFSSACQWQPYAVAGAGITYLTPALNLENHAQTNINVGIGSEYLINPKVTFRGDIKDLYTVDGGKNDILASVGINFYLG